MIKLMLASVLGALTIGAVVPGSALAVTSEWMIEGKTFSELGLKEEEASFTSGSLKIIVPKKLTLECQKVTGSGKAFSGGSDEVTLSLTQCTVLGVPACKVTEPMTMAIKAHEIEAGGYYYDIFEPQKEGSLFAQVNLSGAECSLPAKTLLNGSVVSETSIAVSKKQVITFSEGITNKTNKALKEESASEVKLTFGASQAFLVGELGLELSGKNAGKSTALYNFTRLCKVAQTAQNTCPGPGIQYYPEGQEIKLENETQIKFEFGITTTCTASKLVGTTATDGAAPIEGTFSTVEFNPCNVGTTCTVTTLGLPSLFLFDATGGGGGYLVLHEPEFKFVCGGTTCRYAAEDVGLIVNRGAPATAFALPYAMAKVEVPAACTNVGFWKGAGPLSIVEEFIYKFAAPNPLYVTG
jgi:hypothetical protein